MRIAILGKMGSGKTYISKLLAEKYNLEIYSFGTKVKNIAYELFNMEEKDRKLLQTIADYMKYIDKDVWVNYIIKQIQHKDNIIIDDLRFKNEVDSLKKLGFIIIGLHIDESTQQIRLREKYPNYIEHLDNKKHNSEVEYEGIDVNFRIYSDDKALNKIIHYLENVR